MVNEYNIYMYIYNTIFDYIDYMIHRDNIYNEDISNVQARRRDALSEPPGMAVPIPAMVSGISVDFWACPMHTSYSRQYVSA